MECPQLGQSGRQLNAASSKPNNEHDRSTTTARSRQLLRVLNPISRRCLRTTTDCSALTLQFTPWTTVTSRVATGGTGGRVPTLVPRTDCGIRPDPMRTW